MAVVNCSLVLLTLVVGFVIMSETSNAEGVEEDDLYWQGRMKIAEKYALDAYNPNPSEVTDHLNKHVKNVIRGMNSTRRSMKKYVGDCIASNPIDRCWRCRQDWESNRFRLADCSMGFARGVTGGKGGKIYVVTDSSDSDLLNPKPGTLRHAVIQDEPLWIIFGRPMNIRLQQELMMSSNKTIDARGANVHIAHGAGITVQFVQNIIIHGLHIHDIVPGNGGMIRDSVNHYGFRTRSDGDGISIFGGSKVWIDHVSISNCMDGLVDAIMGSTGITLSNSHFTKHNEAFLFGASELHTQDKIMQITVAFNHFGHGLVQRMPRVRYGFVHVVNNDYTHWLMYAIGGSSQPTIISQGNRFIAPPNIFAKEVTKRDYAEESEWKNWQWRSEGDVMMNGAFFVESGPPFRGFSSFPSDVVISPESGSLVSTITRFAGPLDCKPNKPC